MHYGTDALVCQQLFQSKIAATRKLYGSVSSLLCAYAKGVDLDD